LDINIEEGLGRIDLKYLISSLETEEKDFVFSPLLMFLKMFFILKRPNGGREK
jgi:hypothetical protein